MAKFDRITFDPNVAAWRAEEIDIPRVPTERSGVVWSWDLWNPSQSSGNAIVE
jgi:hypothetical protein